MMKAILIFFLLCVFMLAARTIPEFKGPYLGQPHPGEKAAIFAPGFINQGIPTRDVAMTPDGNEFYYCISKPKATILFTRRIGEDWTAPEVVPHLDHPQYNYIEPAISPDGKTFLFVSNMPRAEKGANPGDYDIWKMERTGTSWSEPENLGDPVNTPGNEFFPSLTRDGTLYLTATDPQEKRECIVRFRRQGDSYLPGEKLPPQVNSGRARFNAFIAPDESYIIVPVFGRPDSLGGTDYYIVFRNPDDRWSDPVHLGKEINTDGNDEYSPYISPDGKYFFFMSARLPSEQPSRVTYEYLRKTYFSPINGGSAIYWIGSGFIERLKAGAFPKN